MALPHVPRERLRSQIHPVGVIAAAKSHDSDQTRLRSPARVKIAPERSPNEPFFELYRRKALAAARRSLAIVSALVG
jgi:hypothetical protein